MNIKKIDIAFALLLWGLVFSFRSFAIEAKYSAIKPMVDGKANEAIWEQVPWYAINHAIIGDLPEASDFTGRYKIVWHESALYLLVEITDDIFSDQEANPLKNYWEDDCLEIFIDEDNSGGNHLNNFNAFAYHVALDGNVVDIIPKDAGISGEAALLNEHVNNQYSFISAHKILWEVEVKVYGDDYQYGDLSYPSKSLSKGNTMGFMLSYCDNDGALQRESFIGSVDIKAQNNSKNLGYITADVFDKLYLAP